MNTVRAQTWLAAPACLFLGPGGPGMSLLPWPCWKWEGVEVGLVEAALPPRPKGLRTDLRVTFSWALVAFGLHQFPQWMRPGGEKPWVSTRVWAHSACAEEAGSAGSILQDQGGLATSCGFGAACGVEWSSCWEHLLSLSCLDTSMICPGPVHG